MSAPSDDEYSESSKHAPKELRDQPQMPAAERADVTSPETAPSSTYVHQDSESSSWPEPMREPPPPRREDVLMNRNSLLFIFAVLVAFLAISAMALWQDASVRNAVYASVRNADSQTLQASKPSDRLAANNAPANSPLFPGTKIAANSVAEPSASATTITTGSVAEPSASAQAQQAPPSPISHPLGQEPRSVNSPVRGVTDSEI